ncbi:Solute carrier family 25 member 38-A [Porphyridium purpureum]|uniref:Solute carrier family 25 member 38-A n=1 Tax=Porphyridium purpureum TaxID=35688 RepID=A0A5J4YYH4_PORPP|nr:Solute carrier family 25 member 38-A [Porphyridium purpureum]|eukprot:POR2447..scf208_2
MGVGAGGSGKGPRSSANFMAGATSGLVTTFLLQPLDVIKTRMQISSHFGRSVGVNNLLFIPDNAGVAQTFRSILANDGPLGLWRGVVPTVLRNMSGVGIYFVSLTRVSDLLRSSDGTLSSSATLVAGATARSISATLGCPLSVIKTRFEAVELASKYTGLFNAVYVIATQEGMRGLFSGLFPMILRDAPYSALYVLFYLRSKEYLTSFLQIEGSGGFDKAKQKLRSEAGSGAGSGPEDGSAPAMRSDTDRYRGMAVNFACGLLGGGIATVLTQPQDVVKTRMQLSRHKHGRKDKYATARQTMMRVFKEEGFYGFFRGSSPRFFKRCLGSAITWMIYEETVMFYETILGKGLLNFRISDYWGTSTSQAPNQEDASNVSVPSPVAALCRDATAGYRELRKTEKSCEEKFGAARYICTPVVVTQ